VIHLARPAGTSVRASPRASARVSVAVLTSVSVVVPFVDAVFNRSRSSVSDS